MSRLPVFSTYARTLAWKSAKNWVRQSFPSVPTISTVELAHQLEVLERPVLIDARKLEEYTLSHLPGAYHAQTVDAVEQADISRNTPVIVYCSIGYRSARLSQALRAAGYQATNLEGSIFQWANEGRTLVTSQGSPASQLEQTTRKVHPYNALWGLLLNSN